MNTTIYIFGHIQTFTQALVALQMLFDPGNNTDWAVGGSLFGVGPIVAIGLLLSLLHISTKGIWTQKIQLHQVGLLLGLYSAMFIPKTDVVVQDVFSGQSQPVSNIPIGVAYPASIVSQLANDAANQIGQAFQLVTSSAPPKDIANGFAAPLQQLLDLRRLYGAFAAAKPELATPLVQFIAQCATPVNRSGAPALSDESLLNSTDLFGTLLNPSSYTSGSMGLARPIDGVGTCDDHPEKCSMSCASAASTLSAAVNNWISETGVGGCKAAMAKLGVGETRKILADCTGADLNGVLVNASGGSVGDLIASASTMGANYVKNVLAACVATAGFQMGATMSQEVKYNLPEYCLIDANTLGQQQISNAGAATIFQQNMLPMMSVLQFLFFALAPLAAAAMVLSGGQGVSMFLKYLTFGMWTQSWLPVAALLNDYAQMGAQQELAKLAYAAAGAVSTTASADYLVHWANLSMVFHNVQQVLSNSYMMLALTPVITMIVFTGSYMGMANLAQDITAAEKVDRNMGAVAPEIGAPTQSAQFGVAAAGAPKAGGAFASDTAAGGLTVGSSQVVSAAVESATARVASAATAAGNSISAAMAKALEVAYSSGSEQALKLTNGIKGTMSQSTTAGSIYKSAIEAGLSEREALSFVTGLGVVTKLAAQAVRSRGGSEKEAAAAAKSAGKAFVAGLRGAAGGLLEGARVGIDAAINQAMESKASREELAEVGRRTQRALDEYATQEFSSGRRSSQTDALRDSFTQAKQDTARFEQTVGNSASEMKRASQLAAISGGQNINYGAALSSMSNRAALGGPSVYAQAQSILMKAYDGDSEKVASAIANAERKGYAGDQALVYAAFLAATGGAAGVSKDGRIAAGEAIIEAVYGTNAGVGEEAANIASQTQTAINSTDAAVKQKAEDLGDAGAAAAAGGASAKGAEPRAQQKVGPPAGVPSGTPQSIGGPKAQEQLHTNGKTRVDGLVPKVPPTSAARTAVERAGENLGPDAPLMELVRWGAANPEQAATAVAATNTVIGALEALAQAFELKQIADLFKSEPNPGPAPTSGGGGAPKAPPGAPGSSGGGALPGTNPPGKPPSAPELPKPRGGLNTAQILDKAGNVIGETSINEIKAAASASGRTVAAEMAARVAAMGGVAARVGGSILRVAAGPLGLAIQMVTHSGDLGADEEAEMARLRGEDPTARERRIKAVSSLMASSQTFAADSEAVKRAVAEGRANDPEVQAAYERMQQAIGAEMRRTSGGQ